MAKETVKENPVTDALKKLREEEADLLVRLKPVQEAIIALEKIVDKSVKKVKSPSSPKESADEQVNVEEEVLEEAN